MDFSSIPNKCFSEIQRLENQIDVWSRNQKEEIQRAQRQHIDFTKEADTKIKQLHKNEKRLQAVIEKNRKDEEKENQDLENVQKQVLRLKEQVDVLPEKVEQLQREAKREESILESKKIELQRAENMKKLKLKEYTSGVSFYQQLLGLAFERIGEKGLRLVFTLIDEQNPLREFYFSIQVTDTDLYELEECQPMVDPTELLTQLNDTNNLSKFVAGMRKKFQEYAAKPMNK